MHIHHETAELTSDILGLAAGAHIVVYFDGAGNVSIWIVPGTEN